MPNRALSGKWPSERADRIEISIEMASQLPIKLQLIYSVEQCLNFENFERSLAHRPINMYQNLCSIEHCLIHGRQRELTELKYLSKWRHNCSSNYTKLTLLSYAFNFEKISRSLAHRPRNMYQNLCPIELCHVHGRQRELTELKHLSKLRHNCSSNNGKITFFVQCL